MHGDQREMGNFREEELMRRYSRLMQDHLNGLELYNMTVSAPHSASESVQNIIRLST